MNVAKRAKLEVVMTQIILMQATIRDVRLREFKDDPKGRGAADSRKATDVLNRIEREMAGQMKALAELVGADLTGEEKAAAQKVAAAGMSQIDRDVERAVELAWDFDATLEARNAARAFLGLPLFDE